MNSKTVKESPIRIVGVQSGQNQFPYQDHARLESLKNYCEKLKKENALLRTELGTIEALRQENETLKENALLRTELEIIEELRKENDTLKYKLLALEMLPEVIEFLDQRRSSSISSSAPINLTIKTSNSTEDVRNIDSDHSTVFNYDNDIFYKDEVSSDGDYGCSSSLKRAAEHGDVSDQPESKKMTPVSTDLKREGFDANADQHQSHNSSARVRDNDEHASLEGKFPNLGDAFKKTLRKGTMANWSKFTYACVDAVWSLTYQATHTRRRGGTTKLEAADEAKVEKIVAEVLGMRFKGIKREDVLKRISAKLTSAKKTMAKKNNEIVPVPLSSEDKKLKMVQIGSITIRKTNSN